MNVWRVRRFLAGLVCALVGHKLKWDAGQVYCARCGKGIVMFR